jgi:prolyl oligopeptidase
MNKPAVVVLAVPLLLAACSTEKPAAVTAPSPKASLTYPPAFRGDTVDTYHGVKVADPYRWLEEEDRPGSTMWPKVQEWVNAQNELTFSYLAGVPQRGAIKDRLTTLWNYERISPPFKEGGRYFYSRNDGLQNQSVFFTVDKLGGSPRMLIDPNTLKADGTVSLTGTIPSEDGKHLAYATSDGGSDWNTWRVMDLATGKDTPDVINWVKFGGVSWTKDGKGFFYSRYPEPKEGEGLKAVNENQKIYYHALGTPQSEDKLIYERPDKPKWYLFGGVTDDGRYHVIYASDNTTVNDAVFYRDLSIPDAPVVELLNKFDQQYALIDNIGTTFYFRTDLNAPRFRVVSVDIRECKDGVLTNPKEIIPQAAESLQGVNLIGGRLFAQYLKDAQTVVKMYSPEGKFLGDVKLPGIGTASGFGGKNKDTETFYTFTNYTTPATVYRYDIPSGRSEVFFQPKVDFNPGDYETKQVFFSSKDGTQVPMFISHKKRLKLDGNLPTLLYGYGGFNISLTPSFSPVNLQWMEMGGVYAVANLRGGGEYGTEWHNAGRKLKKQNVFDDFIAAAEFLVSERYTNPKRLAIQGGSNGGLLVGAVMNQRPDLFGACLPAVGVMDMLRFAEFTVGAGWVADYGSVKNEDEFKALYAYSPYHNLKKGTCYPPTLVTTGLRDDRVFPGHSFKYAAALQHAQGCDNPVLILTETRAGHGAGKPTWMRIEESANIWAFLVKSLNMDPVIPAGKKAAAR